MKFRRVNASQTFSLSATIPNLIQIKKELDPRNRDEMEL